VKRGCDLLIFNSQIKRSQRSAAPTEAMQAGYSLTVGISGAADWWQRGNRAGAEETQIP
jgi:hypothetical protein